MVSTTDTSTTLTKQEVSFYQDNYAFLKSPGTPFKIPLWREGNVGELWVNVWLRPGWQEPSAEGYTNQMQTVHWKDGESGMKEAEFIQQHTGNPIEYISAYIGRDDIWGGHGETDIPGVLESLIAIHEPNIEPAFIERQSVTLIRGLTVIEGQGDPVSHDFTLQELADALPINKPYEELITGDGATKEWLISHGRVLPNPIVEFWYEQASIDLYWEPGGDEAIIFRPTLGLAQGVEVLVRIW
jgi:hypothetical protein